MNIEMKGWKTWVALGCFVASFVCTHLGYQEVASDLYDIAIMFGLVGVGAKLDKTRAALVK
jgi:hypothetical protein